MKTFRDVKAFFMVMVCDVIMSVRALHTALVEKWYSTIDGLLFKALMIILFIIGVVMRPLASIIVIIAFLLSGESFDDAYDGISNKSMRQAIKDHDRVTDKIFEQLGEYFN